MMRSNKLTVNQLTEEQMQKVRDYLGQMPNKPHRGSAGECYGNYVGVTADIRASVDKYTAKTSVPWYENVTFELRDLNVECGYTAKRNAERSEVAKGLVSLVMGFSVEQ